MVKPTHSSQSLENIEFEAELARQRVLGDLVQVGLPIKVKKLHKHAILPTKAHRTDLGLDFYCINSTDFLKCNPLSVCSTRLKPQHTAIFRTGISIQPPTGYGIILKDRSSLGANHNIHVLAGVIDENYIGEVLVCLTNLGLQSYTINPGDKIVQGIFIPRPEIYITEVEELDDTERRTKGFGSSGK